MSDAQVPATMQEKLNVTRDHIKTHSADTAWLLNVIGMFDGEHEIFQKQYEAKPKNEKQVVTRMIADPLNLLADIKLVQFKAKGKLRLPLTSDEKLAQMSKQLEKLMCRQKETGMKIANLEGMMRVN